MTYQAGDPYAQMGAMSLEMVTLRRELEAVRKERDALVAELRPIADRWQKSIDRYTRCGSKQHETMPDHWPVDVTISVKAARVVHALSQPVQPVRRTSPVAQTELDDCYGQGLPVQPVEDAG